MTRQILWMFLLMLPLGMLNSQDYYLELKEIIYRTKEPYSEPTKIEINSNGGELEFGVAYYTRSGRCPEKYRVKWSFNQDMSVLALDNYERKNFGFMIDSERLSGDCGEVNPVRNPTFKPSVDNGGWSWIMQSGDFSDKKIARSFTYKISPPYIYCRTDAAVRKSENRTTGPLNGSFEVYNSDTYEGRYSYLFFTLSGNSNKGKVPEEGVYFEVVYLYQIVTNKPEVTADNPCDFTEPDCSCCPGTIPVWNFKTNQGECICPEGQKWDRISNSCK